MFFIWNLYPIPGQTYKNENIKRQTEFYAIRNMQYENVMTIMICKLNSTQANNVTQSTFKQKKKKMNTDFSIN